MEGYVATVASDISSDADRLLALRETGLLDSPPPAAFAGIVNRAKERFGVATALISLVDQDRLLVAMDPEGNGGALARSDAFCDHTIRSDDVFVVRDLASDPRFADNPLVTGAPFYRFYAGAPLIWKREVRLGALCLLDTRPCDFSLSDRAELALMADDVVTSIAHAEFNRSALRLAR